MPVTDGTVRDGAHDEEHQHAEQRRSDGPRQHVRPVGGRLLTNSDEVADALVALVEEEVGDDRTDDFLQRDGYLLLHISKDLEATQGKAQDALNALARSAQSSGWEMIGLTNATAEQGLAFRQSHDVPYEMYTCDQTELKIVVRSNPGLVLVKNGVVLQKWAWRDFPTAVEDIEAR